MSTQDNAAKRQQFINWLVTLQYATDVFKQNVLDSFAAVPQESTELQHLYTSWAAGNTVYVQNWLIGESGHNLERPDWVSYKADGYTPEINELTAVILHLKDALVSLSTQPDVDQRLIDTLNAQITANQKLLDEYHADLAAEQTNGTAPN